MRWQIVAFDLHDNSHRWAAAIERASSIILIAFVALTALDWLPGVLPYMMNLLHHVLLLAYVALRASYHLSIGKFRVPVAPVVWLPVLLLVLIVPGFHSGMPPGMYLNFFGVLVMGAALLGHVSDPTFDRQLLEALVVAYVSSVVLSVAFALITSYTPVPSIQLPVRTWDGATPPSTVGFFFGPGGFGSVVSQAALFATVFYSQRHRRFLSPRGWLVVAVLLIGATLVMPLVAFSMHGRQGILALLFVALLFFIRSNELRRLLPALAIAPLAGPVVVFLAGRLLPVGPLLRWLDVFSRGRLSLMDGGVRLMIRRPWGVGIERFSEYFVRPHWHTTVFASGVPDGPHNQFLTIGTEAGVLAGLVYLVWIGLIFALARDAIAPSRDTLQVAFGMTVVTRLLVANSVGSWAAFDIYSSIIWWVAFAGVVHYHVENEQVPRRTVDVSEIWWSSEEATPGSTLES